MRISYPAFYIAQNSFFVLSLNLLIGWQLSIWICCRPFSSLLDNYQLLLFPATFFKYCSRGRPTAFFPDIASSRMFTTNSLCLIICPIHEWRLFFKIFKSNLSSFTFWKTSSCLILSVHFIFNILLQQEFIADWNFVIIIVFGNMFGGTVGSAVWNHIISEELSTWSELYPLKSYSQMHLAS